MSKKRETLLKKAHKLPQSPGVYLMKDSQGTIIYVGKAKALKNRVSSYFQSQKNHTSKTRALVREVEDFDVIHVNNEVESLLLERTLIKHHKPQYNILLKDDKEYPYIRIDYKAPWPRLEKVRKRKNDGATYLGPYSSPSQLYIILNLVRKIFPVVRCTEHVFKNAKRPCNYYHIKMCLAPCVLDVTRGQYLDVIKNAQSYIEGKDKEVRRNLKRLMLEASDAERYEQAAQFRDQLKAFDELGVSQFVMAPNIKYADAFGVQVEDEEASVSIVQVRDERVAGNEVYSLIAPMQEPSEVLEAFLIQYYESREVPTELILPCEISQLNDDPKTLALGLVEGKEDSKPPKMSFPKAGLKKQIVELALKNAGFAIKEVLQKKQTKKVALQGIQKLFDLGSYPRRIECIDVSNMQGKAIVASNVCFVDGVPKNSLYRLYNVRTVVDKNNDFLSMQEVVSRRLKRGAAEHNLPDLLVVDGGRQQLEFALKGAEEAGVDYVPIVGLAKSRNLKNEGTGDRPLRSEERVYIPGREKPIVLKLGSPEFRVMTSLRDEAHRFAITHHRRKRKKVSHGSQLDDIKGMGPTLKKKLLDTFDDMEGIKKADLESLSAVKGVSQGLASRIHSYFREEEVVLPLEGK